MCKNTIQFQKGLGIKEFLADTVLKNSVKAQCSLGAGQMALNARNVAATISVSFTEKLSSSAIAVVTKPRLSATPSLPQQSYP